MLKKEEILFPSIVELNRETLPAALRSAGLGYRHMPGLGGLRHACPDSPNKAWRNLSFRGYADYMQTPEFQEDLQVMMDLARKERVGLMCAEAVPWRCHRLLIADALVAWGFDVEHIMSATHCQKHALRPWAVVKGKRVTIHRRRVRNRVSPRTFKQRSSHAFIEEIYLWPRTSK